MKRDLERILKLAQVRGELPTLQRRLLKAIEKIARKRLDKR